MVNRANSWEDDDSEDGNVGVDDGDKYSRLLFRCSSTGKIRWRHRPLNNIV